ncbi:transglycosylase domain-containing protein, partial [Prosthecobacter sp.]
MKLYLPKLREHWRQLPTWLRRLGGACAIVFFIGLVTLGFVWRHYAGIAATYDMEALTRGQNETLIVDVRGELIGSASDIEREPITLQIVPPHLIQAILATEDARFYSHPGFDLVGLTRAAVANFTSKGIRQGGSTITQQLARNAFGLQGRTYERKLTEIFLSMRIESERTKEQILTGYLNRIYLGHGCSGVGAAAQPDVTDLPMIDGPLDNKQAMIGGLVGALGEWGADGEPVTYTGGTITPMQALLEGRTAATVRLGYQVGLDPLRAALSRCGFTTALRTEAAFTLGQSHMRLIELARAFTGIANDGRPCPKPHVLLAASSSRSDEVFSPAAAHHVRNTMISGMMRPEYRLPLVENKLAQKSIAGYGGVTYDRTDAWFIGFDRVLTCLVWIGHDKDIPIGPQATAATAALPLWAAVFEMVTAGQPKGWDSKPSSSQLLA